MVSNLQLFVEILITELLFTTNIRELIIVTRNDYVLNVM